MNYPPFEQMNTIEEARGLLTSMAEEISDRALSSLAFKVLEDSLFWEAPGSKDKHHAYVGGLAIHTAQVLFILRALLKVYTLPPGRFDEVIVAVIWHDYGKIWEYRFVPEQAVRDEKDPLCIRQIPAHIEYTAHKTQIGHLSKSYGEFMAACRVLPQPLDGDVRDRISHMILGHHGRKEWGSPVVPETTEAFAIHCADMLSAQFSQDTHAHWRL
mgnify:FL=1